MSSVERSFKDAMHKVISRLAEITMDTIFDGLVPGIEVIDEENIEKAKAMWGQNRVLYITPNHLSDIDGPAFEKVLPEHGFPEPTFILGIKRKKNLFTWFLAQGIKYKLVWPKDVKPKNVKERLERRRINRELLKWTKSSDAKSAPVVLFLEGTRSRTRTLGEGNLGSTALMPKKTLILTAGIWPTDKIMPIGSRKYRKMPIFVRFGEPIEVDDLYDKYKDLDRSEQRERVMGELMDKIAQLLPRRYLPNGSIK